MMTGDTLFDMPVDEKADPNPCVALYGRDPQGRKCKACGLLSPRGLGHSKRWYKCLLRRASYDTHKLGAASTDHRVNWNACARITIEDEVAQ